MKEFIIPGEERIDPEQFKLVNEDRVFGLLHCSKVRYNRAIKLVMPTSGYQCIGEIRLEKTLDELRAFAKKLLLLIEQLEQERVIDMENISWNIDSIFADCEHGNPYLVYIPTRLVKDGTKGIYLKQIYAVLEELFDGVDGGETIIRQINYQKDKNFADWTQLKGALDKREPEEDDLLVLKSVNTPEPIVFQIGHETFPIGSDPEQVKGTIQADKISPLHATIGWNDISFYIMDHESEEGTFLNDTKITPGTQVPIGKGSVIRFADLTFNIE
jgi:hypothetical protein